MVGSCASSRLRAHPGSTRATQHCGDGGDGGDGGGDGVGGDGGDGAGARTNTPISLSLSLSGVINVQYMCI